eukprot:gene28181-34889_t
MELHIGLDWFKGEGQRALARQYMLAFGHRCELQLTDDRWIAYISSLVITFGEAASVIKRLLDEETQAHEDLPEGTLHEALRATLESSVAGIFRRFQREDLPEGALHEALRATLESTVAGIFRRFHREDYAIADCSDDQFLVLGACTAEKSHVHVTVRWQLGGFEGPRELKRKLAAQAAKPLELLQWVDLVMYMKMQLLRTIRSCKTGRVTWRWPLLSWPVEWGWEDYFAPNVHSDAPLLVPVGGASAPWVAPGVGDDLSEYVRNGLEGRTCLGSPDKVYCSNNFLVCVGVCGGYV